MDVNMGTMAAAEAALEARGRTWRELRQPAIATRAKHRETEAKEREARLRLAEAALLWLWHRENPSADEPEIDLLAKRLAGAELNYRNDHDQKGDGHIETGRRWDAMRRAGDAIRAYFTARGH